MARPLRVEYPGAYYKVTLRTIIQTVCDEFGYREEELKMRGRKNNKARAIAIYLTRDLSGVSCKDLGTFFDGISGTAITVKYSNYSAKIF